MVLNCKIWLLPVVLCTTLTMTSTNGFAAPAKKSGASARDQATTERIVQAKAAQPRNDFAAADPSDPAVTVYKNCMRKKGYQP